ncbi:hypothetical protein [Acetanaerobacterium elongatum]|uniref:hypothetical protein n=1 Tax=Acetanaerobacterium elongatum TaxID=258515 RepID=UPI00115FB8BE|nr:hypothetical protein [Acetanaerobacterium elongatum]
MILLLRWFWPLPVFWVLLTVSLMIGGLLAVFLAVLLMTELRQDKRIARYYEKHQNRALPLSDGRYECQHCGSTRLKQGDKVCPTCGVRFENDSSIYNTAARQEEQKWNIHS